MYCKRCGNIVNDNSRFCGKCGLEIDSPSQPTQMPTETNTMEEQNIPFNTEPVEENDIPQRNIFDKRKKLILGAAVLIVATILIVLFADILPTKQTVFSTPIADFTYTYTYEATYEDITNKTLTAKPNYKFLIIKLTPIDGKSLLYTDATDYPFSETKVFLGNSTYETIMTTWNSSSDGQLEKMELIFVVEEENINEAIEFVLP